MKHRIGPYNLGHDLTAGRFIMPKRKMQAGCKSESLESACPASDKRPDYRSDDLAAEVNISQRMVASYEKETTHPLMQSLALLGKAGVQPISCGQ
jgi:hypothetical protein